MFLLRRPSPADINRFIDRSREWTMSYGTTGITRQPLYGYSYDEQVVPIGRGDDDFERARASLERWKHFDIGWVQLFPAAASVENGTTIAVLIEHFGFWSLNGARVLYD